jgi:hypothetical protein
VPTGINKPYDRIWKSFAEEAPVLLLRLLGFLPEGIEPDIQPLRPETAPAVVLPDYVAAVSVGPGVQVIFHIEFQACYHDGVPSNMARYGGSLAWQYQTTVESVLVLLRRQGVPVHVPEVGDYSFGKTRTTHPFRVVRLWEIDPTPVLETNIPKLLSLAVLMKSTDEQVREIAATVARQGNDEALGRFLMLSSLRYDEDSVYEMVGGKMGLMEAIMEGSSIVQGERKRAAAQGRAEGLAEGLAEGRAKEARNVLRRLLRKKFPTLESLAEIDQIANVETLESIAESVLDTSDADTIHSAIQSAVKSN